MVCPADAAVAQVPTSASPPVAYQLPRFTLRQIILGRGEAVLRIPGAWLRAATLVPAETLAIQAYRVSASRVGIEPLEGNTLRAERSPHVMGLYRRAELLTTSQRTLEAIRTAIPSDTIRKRFDRIFRPRSQWIVDLHDAALAWARTRAPGTTWEAARPALTAAHWLAPGRRGQEGEPLLRALYGLAVLAATDSTSFAAARAALWRADSTSAASVLQLLNGYTEGQRWYADAIDFFLREPWAPDGGHSIQDYVRREWGSAYGPDFDAPLPRIETRWFGYPQALPQYGVPPALFRHLVSADNARAVEWLQHNGQPDLLRTLRWLPSGDTSLALLRTASETLRLTTVSRQSRESLNGFLEPRDAIVIDPGYSPLLALGAVVHEWQHLLFRRRQLERFADSLGGKARPMVSLPGVQPHLAEGFAEWSSERILAPVAERWPLLGFGELEKRADLVQRDPDDQHAIGYALVRALGSALPNPGRTTELLLRHAEHPARVPLDPTLRKSWKKYRGAADRVLREPTSRTLIPEITFTIEDGFPDVVATRILVPVAGHAER